MPGQTPIGPNHGAGTRHIRPNRHTWGINHGQGDVGQGAGAYAGGHDGAAITTGVHTGTGAAKAT